VTGWPPPGGNWEGGTVVDGRNWEHVPHRGWRDVGPARPHRLGQIYRDPRTLRRRSRLARWLDVRRHSVLAVTVVAVVVGYATTVAVTFDHTLPTMRTAGVLVIVGGVLVGVLLTVMVWAHRE
jgi:hypothetical protein